jgi:hypothetical protein
MEDFLRFRKMITPVFIEGIFWLGVVVLVLAALFSFTTQGFGTGLAVLLIGVPLGVIIWRMYCEILIVFFRILSVLVEIREGQKSASQSSVQP